MGPYDPQTEGLRVRKLNEAQVIAPQLENRYEALYTLDQARSARYASAERQAQIVNDFEARIKSDDRRYRAAVRLLVLSASKNGQIEQVRNLGVPSQDTDLPEIKRPASPQALEREKQDRARTARLADAARIAAELNPVIALQKEEQAREQALSQMLSASIQEGNGERFRQTLDQLPPERRLPILSDIAQHGSDTIKSRLLDYLPNPLPKTDVSSEAFEAYINFSDFALDVGKANRAGEFLLVASEKADGEYGITDRLGIKDFKARDLCKSGQLATIAIRFARMGDFRQAEDIAMSTNVPLHRMAVHAAVLLEELKRADHGLVAALQPGGEEGTLLDALSPFPLAYKLCGLR